MTWLVPEASMNNLPLRIFDIFSSNFSNVMGIVSNIILYKWIRLSCRMSCFRNKGRKGRARLCYNPEYIFHKQALNIHSSWQWLLILLQNTLELHSQLDSEVTFNRIAHYSRHILSLTYSIPPSPPLSILLLTFGWQPERSPFSRHVSAQRHSHGLCFFQDPSFIPSKAFVAGWKLADAGAIKPKLLDQYKHPSLSPTPFSASQ